MPEESHGHGEEVCRQKVIPQVSTGLPDLAIVNEDDPGAARRRQNLPRMPIISSRPGLYWVNVAFENWK